MTIINNENKGLGGKSFLTILADGKFHKKCDESVEGAVKREIKDKMTGEVTDTVFETIHDSVLGQITGITVIDGKFGKNLQVNISDEVISVGVKSSFGEDLLKKLPAVDFSKDNVTLTPFAFVPKGKETKLKGVSVYQGSIKLDNVYFDKDTKTTLKGCPTPENGGKGFDSDDWTAHFNNVRKFMIKQIEKLPVFKATEVAEVKEEIDNF